MKKIIFLLLLLPIFSFAQEGGYRSLKTKSAKVTFTDFAGSGYRVLLVSPNGDSSYLPNGDDNEVLTIKNGVPTFYPSSSSINDSVQIFTATNLTWDIDRGINAKLSISGNTTIVLSNLPVAVSRSGSLTVINSATQYTLNITQSGYVNAISKTIGTIGNYTKINLTGASKVDKYSWSWDGYYLFWKGENDFITQ